MRRYVNHEAILIRGSGNAHPQTGWTEPVPAEYMVQAEHPETVERLDYATRDYARSNEDIQKKAYIYLPYGYGAADTETRYDIVYLMHGWGGSAGEYFRMANLKYVFDNLIEKGDMKPVILVSATFYTENSSGDFIENLVQEQNLDERGYFIGGPCGVKRSQEEGAPASDSRLKKSQFPTRLGSWLCVKRLVHRSKRYFVLHSQCLLRPYTLDRKAETLLKQCPHELLSWSFLCI